MFVQNKHVTNEHSEHIPNFHKLSNVNTNELAPTNTIFKDYQTLLDRFRRKTTNIEVINDNKSLLYDNTVFKSKNYIESVNNGAAYDEENNTVDNDSRDKQNSSMQKLRVDDTTLTKIFHDFSSTVNKNRNETNEFNSLTEDFNKIIDFDLINKKDSVNSSLNNANNIALDLTRVLKSHRYPKVSNFKTPGPSHVGGKSV